MKGAVCRREKQAQATKAQFRNIAWSYRDAVRETKAELELKVAQDISSSKRSPQGHTHSKCLTKGK